MDLGDNLNLFLAQLDIAKASGTWERWSCDEIVKDFKAKIERLAAPLDEGQSNAVNECLEGIVFFSVLARKTPPASMTLEAAREALPAMAAQVSGMASALYLALVTEQKENRRLRALLETAQAPDPENQKAWNT